jgi:tRNA modification GTPase
LDRARDGLEEAREAFRNFGSGDLVAQGLRQAQQALGTITGAIDSDQLLGEIFASFCVGK